MFFIQPELILNNTGIILTINSKTKDKIKSPSELFVQTGY